MPVAVLSQGRSLVIIVKYGIIETYTDKRQFVGSIVLEISRRGAYKRAAPTTKGVIKI